MKRKLLSFSMALCLSAMGVSAFAQTSPTFEQSDVNKCTCTLDVDITASSEYTVARLEVNDKILGDWGTINNGQDETSTFYDNRSKAITLEGWVYYLGETTSKSPETTVQIKGLDVWKHTANNNQSVISYGRVLLGHRQGQFGGYGSEPSFSVSLVGPKALALFSRVKNSQGGFDTMSNLPDPIEIPVKEWFHLALVAEVTGEASPYTLSYKVYVNGVEKLSATDSNYGYNILPYLPDNTNDMGCDICFGGSVGAKFDDLMVWTKALSKNEIQESIKGYAGTSFPDNLVGYYLCDDMLTEPYAYSANLVSDNENFPLVLQALKYTYDSKYEYVEFSAKQPLAYDRIKDITPIRQFYRGEAPSFYSDENGTSMAWSLNGNEENFKYVVNTDASPLYIKGYNGKIERMNAHNSVDYQEPDCIGLYYNGSDNQYVPVLVSADMYQEGAPATDPEYSYLMGGFEYTVQMPKIGVWQTIGFPTPVDLVSDDNASGVLLRPAYNFWYSWIKDGYTSLSDAYEDYPYIENDTDSKNYLLDKDGVISVPEARDSHIFRFYTQSNTPVVFRAKGHGYTSERLPESGKIGFVANPYMTDTKASEFCSGCTLYQLEESGWYMPTTGDVEVAPFGSVLVYNGNSATAPKAINTKTTTGVLELEALSDINVRGAKESIEVVTFEPATVTVYTVGGTMVANAQVEGTETFALPAGIYVVKAVAGSETETFKVVVE